MSEEPINDDPNSPQKLSIDDPSDFLFHAAYVTYAEVYDRTQDSETRKQLNQNIMALQQNQIDCSTFYRNISQYRSIGSFQQGSGRAFIKTQRKQEWRRQTQKIERNKRHRK